MIKRNDLLNEIEACQRLPVTEKQFDRLASAIIIYSYLYGEEERPPVHAINEPVEVFCTENDGNVSDFLRIIDGKAVGAVLPIIDEFVQTVGALYPKLYESLLRKLSEA